MTRELKISPIVNGGGAIALWKVSWGFDGIHYGAPFGVCGTASTNHRFDVPCIVLHGEFVLTAI